MQTLTKYKVIINNNKNRNSMQNWSPSTISIIIEILSISI